MFVLEKHRAPALFLIGVFHVCHRKCTGFQMKTCELILILWSRLGTMQLYSHLVHSNIYLFVLDLYNFLCTQNVYVVLCRHGEHCLFFQQLSWFHLHLCPWGSPSLYCKSIFNIPTLCSPESYNHSLQMIVTDTHWISHLATIYSLHFTNRYHFRWEKTPLIFLMNYNFCTFMHFNFPILFTYL